MTTFAVTYTYADDSAALEKVRPDHRAFLRELNAAGTLHASGPLPGAGGALLILEAVTAGEVESILDDDPFAKAGLIVGRGVREWEVVIGGFATS
ncbi:YciI family protein [Antribacter sp. KLBMP9083]|uniref:YciI family protein n=1 Tax=Antribacter soli TaxID=2910976 RepID=A0AA41QD17_9MICO|nr:YciI family protein [Antribacter soli]MCF4121204.1 YciI family protein [Antribacter soli]